MPQSGGARERRKQLWAYEPAVLMLDVIFKLLLLLLLLLLLFWVNFMM
jgi:hypothetical protein